MTNPPLNNPGHYTRQFGPYTVTAINDGTLNLTPAILRGIAEPDANAILAARWGNRTPHAYLNAYLVQGEGRTILIDTGAATSMGPTAGRLLPNLAAAGIQPGDIDIVLLTHFHPDHTGGLVTNEGTPTFPNAALSADATESAFWLDTDPESAPEPLRPYLLAARAAAAPYQNRFTRSSTQPLAPALTPIPLPGHTPGHTGYRIGDGPEALLIWGDIMHLPDIQAPHPEASVMFDLDPTQAEATRRQILDTAATDHLTIAGMHLHFPGFSRIERTPTAYTLLPDPWSPQP